MDKIIVTALLLIAGATSAVLMFNSIYPAMSQSTQAMVGMERRIDEQMKSEVQIIHAAQSSTDNTVLIWVKNVGSIRVIGVNTADLFFGPQGAFTRIPYGGNANPHWVYSVQNASDWDPTATIQITIVGYSPLNPGQYFCKFVLPNGVVSDYYFSW